MSKSGAPLANFGAQMSTGAMLFPSLAMIALWSHIHAPWKAILGMVL